MFKTLFIFRFYLCCCLYKRNRMFAVSTREWRTDIDGALCLLALKKKRMPQRFVSCQLKKAFTRGSHAKQRSMWRHNDLCQKYLLVTLKQAFQLSFEYKAPRQLRIARVENGEKRSSQIAFIHYLSAPSGFICVRFFSLPSGRLKLESEGKPADAKIIAACKICGFLIKQ